ncbi:hypothetical protein SYJ56_10635 [Algoriphagus sp. D3-2-R+10]|uniref:hypothetical protein n=1 Tax=Algoriphagus aurantiacus TaxID=3103948 RepID=UPI002B3ED8B2|nr:hypothetical protein [Algoriphagus sp. D3-2-R+10]MEB2775763.1 hypothetical protein [Algoriphagus sp. D3-2-R+10]
MNKTKSIRNLLLAVSAGIIAASCTEKEEGPVVAQSEVSIAATISTSEQAPGARTNNLIYENFEISDIKVSIDNVKLILRGTTEGSNKPSIVQIRNNSPQILTLVEDGVIYEPIIGTAMAYDGIYGKLDFDLVQAKDIPEEDSMYGLSVYAKATWFGIPAIVYIDLEEEVNVMFNQGIEVDGAKDLYLTLYLDKFLEGVDPSLVSDGNGDGLVEVGPNDEDGNSEAYAAITANMKDAMTLKNGKFKEDKSKK